MNSEDQPASGRLVGREHRFPVRVYFEDTDLSGIVYHANYLRYMERARSDMLRTVGIDQRAVHEAGGGVYAVADLSIRYKRPAKLDDALLVLTQVIKVTAPAVRIHQRVMRGQELLTEAEVLAAFVSPDGRPRRQPRAWLDLFATLLEEG